MDSQIDKVLNQMFYKEFSHLDQCNDIYVDRKFSSKFEDSIKEIFTGLNETSGNNRRKQCKNFSIIVSLSILFFSLTTIPFFICSRKRDKNKTNSTLCVK